MRGLDDERRARLLERTRAMGFDDVFLESGRVVFVRDFPGDTLQGLLYAAGSAPVPPRGGNLLAGYRFHEVGPLGRWEAFGLWPLDGSWHHVRVTRLLEPWWSRQRRPPASPSRNRAHGRGGAGSRP